MKPVPRHCEEAKPTRQSVVEGMDRHVPARLAMTDRFRAMYPGDISNAG